MVKIAKQAGQKCTLNKPLHCPKNGDHLNKDPVSSTRK
jgi:hypothetical protein